MFWRRSLLFCGTLSMMLAGAAAERRLAGIGIGDVPEDVIRALGPPTARIVAQPPAELRTPGLPDASPLGMPALPMGTMAAPAEKIPNTLIFVPTDNSGEREIPLSDSPSASGGTASTDTPVTPVTPGSGSGGGAQVPPYAYVVLPAALALNQQQYVYKINDTYSIGITITGEGPEAKVTDIVACNLAPLAIDAKTKRPRFDRGTMFVFKYGKHQLVPAGTSKGVTMGSPLDEVLKNHNWTEYFYPFVSTKASTITLGGDKPSATDVTVPPRFGSSGLLGTAGLPSPTGPDGATEAAGDFPVAFTDGKDFDLKAGFASNCVLIYPSDQVAFTLINFVVVRIQVGDGVVKPPDPPKPPVAAEPPPN